MPEIVGTYLRHAHTDVRVSCFECGVGLWAPAGAAGRIVCPTDSSDEPSPSQSSQPDEKKP